MIAYASHEIGTSGLVLAFVMLCVIGAVIWCITTDSGEQTDTDDGPVEPPPVDHMRP